MIKITSHIIVRMLFEVIGFKFFWKTTNPDTRLQSWEVILEFSKMFHISHKLSWDFVSFVGGWDYRNASIACMTDKDNQ